MPNFPGDHAATAIEERNALRARVAELEAFRLARIGEPTLAEVDAENEALRKRREMDSVSNRELKDELAKADALIAELKELVEKQDETVKESLRAMAVGARFREALEQIASGEDPRYPGGAITVSQCVVLAVEALHR